MINAVTYKGPHNSNPIQSIFISGTEPIEQW